MAVGGDGPVELELVTWAQGPLLGLEHSVLEVEERAPELGLAGSIELTELFFFGFQYLLEKDGRVEAIMTLDEWPPERQRSKHAVPVLAKQVREAAVRLEEPARAHGDA